MRKSSASSKEPTAAQKAKAIARALKEIEAKYTKPFTGKRAPAVKQTAAQKKEAQARIEAARQRSREHMEQWMRDLPWFPFYSPYHSVLQPQIPEFVDHKGRKLTFRNPSAARQLLYLAKAAADEYLCGNQLTEQEWRKALGEWKRLINEMRSDLAGKNFEFRDPLGASVTPNFEELGPIQT